jgi:sugar lactone lactonase YvrE
MTGNMGRSETPSAPIPCSAKAGLLTEGPRWHAEAGELLWVDILGSTLHRARPGTDGALELQQTITVDRHVGAVAPATNGGYVLAAGTGFLYVDDAGTVHELAQPEAGRSDVRKSLISWSWTTEDDATRWPSEPTTATPVRPSLGST